MRLTRVHFAQVGHRDARLDPLTLDLDGEDTVLWLRNGGGKSSILSLFYSVFLPSQLDFLGRRAEAGTRRLSDYVGADDLAAVVTEWTRTTGPTIGEPRRVLVGRAMGWPTGKSRDASRLQSLYFSMEAAPDGLGALPLDGLAGSIGSVAGLKLWLRELHARHPERHVVWQEQQGAWMRHLETIGLDPELFKYQIRMNQREGAADESFRFGSAEDFVDFLLELALDRQHANETAGNLEGLRDKLAGRPAKELELRFLRRVQGVLDPLRVALGRHREAAAAVDVADGSAGGLAAALVEDAARLDALLASLDASLAALDEQRRRTSNHRDQQHRFARGLVRRQRELEVAAAEARVAVAESEVAGAATAVRVAKAAVLLRRVRAVRAECAELERLLAAEDRARAPRLAAVRQAGGALVAALGVALTQVEEALSDVAAERAKTDRERARLGALREEAGRQAERGRARIGELDRLLRRRDAERERLREAGWLETRERAVDAAERWRVARGEATAAGARAEAAERSARAAACEHRAVAGTERERAREHQGRAERLGRELAAAEQDRDRLATDALLCEVEEVDRADPLAEGVAGRLRVAADGLRRQSLEHAARTAEDRVAVVAMAEPPFLAPPSADVRRVHRALAERGVSAFAGGHYLAENLPADRRADAMRRDPARFAGVIVQSADALEVAAGVDVALAGPVQVSLGRLHQTPSADAVVLPGRPSQWSEAAAAQERADAEERLARADREDAARTDREQRLRGLAAKVERFARAWGAGRLELVRQQVDSAAALAAQHAAAAERRDGLAGEADARADDARARGEAAREAAHDARRADDALAAFLRDHEDHREGWLAEKDALQDAVAAQVRTAEAHARELVAVDARRDALGARQVRLGEQRRGLEAEVAEVAHRGPAPDEAMSVEEARQRYTTLARAFDRDFGDSRLQGQLTTRQQDLADGEVAYAAAARDLDRDAVVAVRDPDAALAAAEDAVGAAHRTLGAALAERERCRGVLRDLRGRREGTDLPPGEPPATVEACAAAAAAANAEGARATEVLRGLEEQTRRATVDRAKEERRRDRRSALGRRLADLELVAPPAVVPLPPDDDLERAVDRARAAVLEARRAASAAESAVRARVDAVRAVANHDDFVDHQSQVKARLREPAEELIARADALGEGVGERLRVLVADLEALERHQRTIVSGLGAVGEAAERLVNRANQVSRLPDTLEAWGGQPFLRLAFTTPDTPTERDARLAGLVQRLVRESSLPDGLRLAQLAMRELMGGSLRATVLKPDAFLRADRIPIAAMSTFSRGQQLTAAILLYCTLAQLRARSRGRARGHRDAGVLVLDNPVGTCSSVPLIALQRRVAERLGVQLVYTTGVLDDEAIDVFPNLLRLRNEHQDRHTGNRHLTLEVARSLRLQVP